MACLVDNLCSRIESALIDKDRRRLVGRIRSLITGPKYLLYDAPLSFRELENFRENIENGSILFFNSESIS